MDPVLEKASDHKTEDAIFEVVMRYIDRMCDVCPEHDPADKILSEFTKDVSPILAERYKEIIGC